MTLDHLSKAPFNLDAAALAWVRERFAALCRRGQAAATVQPALCRQRSRRVRARIRAFRPGGITRHIGSDVAAERALIAGFNAARARAAAGLGRPRGQPHEPCVRRRGAQPAGARRHRRPRGHRRDQPHHGGGGAGRRHQLELHAGPRHQRRLPQRHRRDPRLRRGRRDHRAPRPRPSCGCSRSTGVAATVKHWPGEGFDDRDQHLVTTVNPLSHGGSGRQTFGRLYRAAIEAGVLSRDVGAYRAARLHPLDRSRRRARGLPAGLDQPACSTRSCCASSSASTA